MKRKTQQHKTSFFLPSQIFYLYHDPPWKSKATRTPLAEIRRIPSVNIPRSSISFFLYIIDWNLSRVNSALYTKIVLAYRYFFFVYVICGHFRTRRTVPHTWYSVIVLRIKCFGSGWAFWCLAYETKGKPAWLAFYIHRPLLQSPS